MPQSKTIKTGNLFRTFSLDRAGVDKENRTIPLTFSSESPVERWFGNEILDHGHGSVRMDRLRTGGPLLLDHNPEDQIGVIEQVLIGTDRRGQAVVRFGKSPRAEEIYQDVLDGIRQNVSVGYRIHSMILEEEKDGLPTYRANDWEPYEVSIVSIPADTSVGVGRAEDGEAKEIKIILKEERNMNKCRHCGHEHAAGTMCQCEGARAERAALTPPAGPSAQVVAEGVRKNVDEILSLGEQHGCNDLARKFIKDGKSVEDFRAAVLEEKYKAKPIQTPVADLGMTDKEKRQYSIIKAIRQLADHEPLDGLEREVSDAVAKQTKREAKGFFIPNDIMTEKRSMRVEASGSGGYSVESSVMGDSMIEILRNKTLVSQLGARTLSGLVGNILLPRQSGGATAYWRSETGEVTASDQTFQQLALTPHRLVGDTAYSKELLMQSSIDVESFVRNDLMSVLAVEKDRAAINGLGANGEPLGIMNTTGINTVTFGAAATWAKVIQFESEIAIDNADLGAMAYLTTPAVRGKWKAASKVTNAAAFLWENGLVNGYRAEASNQVPSDKVVFGNWNDLIIAEWAGVDVVVDPYSLKKQGLVEITVTLWTDMGVRHAVSFCVSTDSGAQ